MGAYAGGGCETPPPPPPPPPLLGGSKAGKTFITIKQKCHRRV
ncbi:hypothetical protein ABG752_00360 [Streptococcus iniae]